jgi:hypothetical protein
MEVSDEHKIIRKVTHEFAEKELLPGVIERDENALYPKEVISKMNKSKSNMVYYCIISNLALHAMLLSKNREKIKNPTCRRWQNIERVGFLKFDKFNTGRYEK